MATVTKTLKTSGGDYSSIETWNSTESTNLVTDGDEHVLEISEGTFLTVDSGLVLSGWTTGASNRLTIKAASGEELLPVVESQGTSNGDVVFNLYTPYITLQDIIARHSTTYNSAGRTVDAPTQDDGVIVQRLIIDGGPRALTITGYDTSVTVTSIIRNCEVHGGAYNFAAFEQIILQNVTFTDTAIINIRDQPRSASTKIQNVFAPDWSYTNPGSYGTISNNAATDTSAPGTSAVNSVVTGDAFTDYTGGDYTVKDTGSDLYDAGADLSGSFTDDILGNTRSTWDIGAYEYISAGATEAAVSFGLSANSLFAADGALSASTNFGISANTTNTAQADRNASVGAALSFGSSNIGDAQAEAASSLITSFGVSDSAQADTYASVNAGFVFGYTVTATVVSGAAIQAAVTFAKTLNVSAEAQADFQAAISAGTVFGKTATAEVSFGANITAGVQSGAQATADAQTEAAISVGATLAAAIIAQAAVEAGISVASVSNVTFSATSVSGDVITPDGRTFTVTAEARAFTVSEEDRTFTVQ